MHLGSLFGPDFHVCPEVAQVGIRSVPLELWNQVRHHPGQVHIHELPGLQHVVEVDVPHRHPSQLQEEEFALWKLWTI